MSERGIIVCASIAAITFIAALFLMVDCQKHEDEQYSRAQIGIYATPSPAKERK